MIVKLFQVRLELRRPGRFSSPAERLHSPGQHELLQDPPELLLQRQHRQPAQDQDPGSEFESPVGV